MTLRTARIFICSLVFALVPLYFASAAHAALSIESFTAETASTEAGAHSDATADFTFRTTLDAQEGVVTAGGLLRETQVRLPPGLVAEARNVPRCAAGVFRELECPSNTQVGSGRVTVNLANSEGPGTGPQVAPVQVYNMVPAPNQPFLLGIQVDILGRAGQVLISGAVHAANHYAATLYAPETPRPLGAILLGVSLTLWGVPASPAHDAQRACNQFGGQDEIGIGSAHLGCVSEAPPLPFVENPTDCAGDPLTELAVDSYEEPEVFTTALAASPIPTSCAGAPFGASVVVSPETGQAGGPTGLNFDLTLPQSNAPEGQGTADLEKAVVTLPQGMTISPSAASQPLEGCTNEQFAAGSDTQAQCPANSVIGTDEVKTPLLPPSATGEEGKLTGKIFLGQPLSSDPTSGQMFRVFQELQGFGVDVKMEGSVTASPETGQLTATFGNLPELPFQNFRLHFNGGPNAVLVNPPTCGPHATSTQLFPYSNPGSPATPSATFDTSYDGSGALCPAPLPFSPAASVSTASAQAGASSPLSVTFARADGTQALGQIDAKLPQGLLGFVSKVPLCEAAAASAGTCPAESRIGTVSTSAGAGSDPLTVQGSVYLARGSDGYPFMLSVVVPAVAGPYDLGNVVVPVWLQVNSDGSITAVSGQLPSILDGIPLDIRSVTMTLDRPGFAINPTNCAALSLTGSVSSLSGTLAPISAPFQASGCTSLPFAPSLTTATLGSTSKAGGASLTVRITQKPGDADIHSVHVELPHQLASRLTTLQKACTEAQFNSDPAHCPAGSVVGTATAITPTLSSPLTGPAILVSHGGAAFPDMEIVLQGEGVTVVLDGQTDIKKGITSSTFASVPDVPIGGFELTLPEGPYSLLSPDGTLCTSKLSMPTTIVGQNGTTVTQSTRIAVNGCPKPKPVVSVVKTKAKAGSLMVTFKTTAAGTVTLSGAGLDTKTKKNVKTGASQIEVSFTKAGQTLRARHAKLELHARLDVGKQAVATKTTSVEL
jgi:hypothetical protein